MWKIFFAGGKQVLSTNGVWVTVSTRNFWTYILTHTHQWISNKEKHYPLIYPTCENLKGCVEGNDWKIVLKVLIFHLWFWEYHHKGDRRPRHPLTKQVSPKKRKTEITSLVVLVSVYVHVSVCIWLIKRPIERHKVHLNKWL